MSGNDHKECQRSQKVSRASMRNSLVAGRKQSKSSSHSRIPSQLQMFAMLLLRQISFGPVSGWRVGAHNFRHGLVESSTSAFSRSIAPVASQENDNPLTEVRWLTVNESLEDVRPRAGSMIMPICTDPGTHLPGTSQVLEIIEPRYVDMYDDIIYSGTRRFVMVRTDFDNGRIAEVGTVFHLDDLQEVPSDLDDWVSYIGKHSAVGRVKVLRILNPQANYTLETYMRAEVVEFTDGDYHDEDTSAAEAELRKLLTELVDMQGQLDEEPRFSDSTNSDLPLGRKKGSEERDLWETILQWQHFLEKRRAKYQKIFQRGVLDEIQKYIESDTVDKEDRESMREWFQSAQSAGNLPVYDIPDEQLHSKLINFQQDLQQELRDMQSHPYGPQFAPLLQSSSHSEQLSIFGRIIDKEHKRLSARMMLQSVLKE
mmetsp:Transcript_166709/g.320070  ORF Transcript_166709/g.320070 Transcript_166709/m.320070 type:complete len:427 (+) Transcript_166709:160-1440(+)